MNVRQVQILLLTGIAGLFLWGAYTGRVTQEVAGIALLLCMFVLRFKLMQ